MTGSETSVSSASASSHESARRHLLILLVLTLIVQGVMFVTYPQKAGDDNETYSRYIVNQIDTGNWLVGNVRYNTGFSILMTPVVQLSRLAGRWDERLVLLFQTSVSAAIPFLLYDIVRRRRSAREALVVALVALVDPFGLQVPHFFYSEWLVSFLLVAAIWLIQRGLDSGRPVMSAVFAGVVLGYATLARVNFAPVVGVFGIALWFLPGLTRAVRGRMFLGVGLMSVTVLALYLTLIHVPSTGTWNPSCIGGVNLMNSLLDKDVPVVVSNGPTTAQYASLLMLPATKELHYDQSMYPRWRTPGPWATEAERVAFFAGNASPALDRIEVAFPAALNYYMGPCALDTLLRQVHSEALAAHPGTWVAGVVRSMGALLVQNTLTDMRPQMLETSVQTEAEATLFGFARATDHGYGRQWVWLPGMKLYGTLFSLLSIVKWLTPVAIIWAFLSKAWVYRLAALLLVTFIVVTALVTQSEPRYIMAVYPLWPVLLGGMFFRVWAWSGSRAG